MARLTPQEAAEKWARRLQGATEDISKGVARVTEAPGKKAAAKQQKMLTRLTESVNSGTWARRISAVTLEDWKRQMLEKGIARLSGGVQAAQPKSEAFMSQLLPAVDAARGKIASMPDLTVEDSIARMSAYVREMAKFKKR